MEINATLVVQMVHFFVAWVMFKKLLLEPALEVILADTAEQRNAQGKIATLRSDVVQHKDKKAAQWSAYQHHFRKEMPRVTDEKEFFLFRNLGKPLKPVIVDHSVVREAKKRLEKVLVKKLGQVNE